MHLRDVTLPRVSFALVLLLGLAILWRPQAATALIGGWTRTVLDGAGSLFLWLATGLLLLAAALALGPAGRYRLGARDEAPEFGRLAWLAMLFAAGMGSGLVFWGVAEPLTHAQSLGSASRAMALTWFHWGLHAWAIYALAALAIAWFTYRRGRPELPSAALGHPAGRAADLLAIVAVSLGVAGALANSVILLHTGIGAAAGHALPTGATHAWILAALSLAFLASASSGLRHGIRWLSTLNVAIAAALLLALAVLGPTSAMLKIGADALGEWLTGLPRWSVARVEVPGDPAWAREWTLIYLVWWIAWTPFVGLFIARISRGRSLREFIAGVVLVPTVFSMLWFAVLGGGALGHDAATGGALGEALQRHYTEPLFTWLAALPAGAVLAWTACALLFVFMITSADSAAYVLGMLAGGGHEHPPLRSRLAWGLLLSALTAGLLMVNDVDVNKSVAIAGAIPFAVVLVLQVIALLRDLRR